MTKGEAKQAFLHWLDEATINGFPASKQLTADLCEQFDYLLDGVVSFLAGQFPLEREYILENGVAEGIYRRFKPPADFRELDRIVTLSGGRWEEVPDYMTQGGDFLFLPQPGLAKLLYWANPPPIPPDAPDDTVLIVEPRAVQLVPLKCAVDALSGNEDKAGLAHYLEGKFSNTLVNILGTRIENARQIKTVYSMGG